MRYSALSASCGPFDRTRKNVDEFCHNLFISHAISECVEKLIEVEKQYEKAIADNDEMLAKQKRVLLQTYQSSLQLTAHIYEEVDEILS